ncbi:putative MFS family arabinose efflux permease [Tepidamorphus gemmatus]|uniref:Putative MFS family arabinose efflux permease n=1 Tax=Tepidamorphus gemmatus TaxID=747076 RepID=A0A4V2UYY4_9HYPH|nr:MFS transporter [Tepidamorphus gemmatus]TCT09268.1 putative MFS family arabinose efflux permease [Tepidamorphus gemmatus]
MTVQHARLPDWLAPTVIVVCGCLISAIAFGPRSAMGLFLTPLSEARGWSREVFALALAIQNLVWGFGQPLLGAVADRWGEARVMVLGAVLYAGGLALTAYTESQFVLMLASGILVGLGIAGCAFALVISAFSKLLPAESRSWAFGIGMASGSLGQFIFAPIGMAFLASFGWQTALYLFALMLLAVPFLAIGLRAPARGPALAGSQTFGQALGEAFGHRSYILLVSGFFVCGFQVAFITVHMPSYLNDIGLDASYGAWSLAVIGLFNVIGAYSAGVLGGRLSKRWILCWIYFLRSAVIAAFILLPVSPASVMIFSAAIGLLWLSTVPPTSGLVALMFGPKYMGTLFGFVFLSHQVGSFLGIWLGGVFYAAYGNYDMFWWLAILAGLFAAAVHYPIREVPVARLQPAR